MAAARHRDSLRGVLERVFSLRQAVEERHGDAIETVDRDLAQLVDRATIAASRVDELESQLAEIDLHDPAESVRRTLRERDVWAARLNQLTAFLDALHARYAALDATRDGGESDADEALAELRARVEALEEVASL